MPAVSGVTGALIAVAVLVAATGLGLWWRSRPDHPAVAQVKVDVEEHLGAVTALRIRRTPTLLILDRRGGIASQAGGLPDRADVEAALRPLVGAG